MFDHLSRKKYLFDLKLFSKILLNYYKNVPFHATLNLILSSMFEKVPEKGRQQGNIETHHWNDNFNYTKVTSFLPLSYLNYCNTVK